jgi:diguanylate cyclase (GGDEF)-like protein
MLDVSVQKRLKVLLIEDKAVGQTELHEQMKKLPCDLTEAAWLSEGMEQLSTGAFDAILLNLELRVSKGLRTFELLRKHAGDCPIIVLADHEDDPVAIGALRAGANYCLTRDQLATRRMTQAVRFAIERNQFEITRNRLIKDLEEQATHDQLTGLPNRRFFEQAALREIGRAQRLRTPLGVVMVDVDHLKSFNDSYGHDVGDKLICETGRHLQSQVRQYDMVCRLGGDEFVLLMPGMSMEDAVLRAEKIRQGTVMHLGGNGNVSLTVSLGIAVYPYNGGTVEELLKAADRALYMAKDGGRNMTAMAPVVDNLNCEFASN